MHIFKSGLLVVPPKIIVPSVVRATTIWMQERLKKEFSLLCRGAWTEKGFLLSEEIYVPRQRVSSASVDFLEDLGPLRRAGYVAILHNHPFSMARFSSADEETINVHFPVSVLLVEGEPRKGSLSLEIEPGCRLLVEALIEVGSGKPLELDLSPIEEERPRPVSGRLRWPWTSPFEDFELKGG